MTKRDGARRGDMGVIRWLRCRARRKDTRQRTQRQMCFWTALLACSSRQAARSQHARAWRHAGDVRRRRPASTGCLSRDQMRAVMAATRRPSVGIPRAHRPRCDSRSQSECESQSTTCRVRVRLCGVWRSRWKHERLRAPPSCWVLQTMGSSNSSHELSTSRRAPPPRRAKCRTSPPPELPHGHVVLKSSNAFPATFAVVTIHDQGCGTSPNVPSLGKKSEQRAQGGVQVA